MTVQIPLRRKYLDGRTYGYPGGENPAPRKRRTKLGDIKKRSLPPQPLITLVVDGAHRRGFQRTGEWRQR